MDIDILRADPLDTSGKILSLTTMCRRVRSKGVGWPTKNLGLNGGKLGVDLGSRPALSSPEGTPGTKLVNGQKVMMDARMVRPGMKLNV